MPCFVPFTLATTKQRILVNLDNITWIGPAEAGGALLRSNHGWLLEVTDDVGRIEELYA